MLKHSIEKKMIWDRESQHLVLRTEVVVRFVTNQGSVVLEAGPLYCSTAQEIFYAVQQLTQEIRNIIAIESEGGSDDAAY